MEMTQYQKDLVRMWDSMREEYKGNSRCSAVKCEACPLHECCYGDDGNTLFNVEKAIEIVTRWAKEHPFVTNEQKFKETFGVEPKNKGGFYFCPHIIGCDCPNYRSTEICNKCKQDFWGAEYKPPKTDKEGASE